MKQQGYNQYQEMAYQILHGRKPMDVSKKPSLWDLKFRGQNVKLGAPYPVCVQERKNKVAQGWKHSCFTITRHV